MAPKDEPAFQERVTYLNLQISRPLSSPASLPHSSNIVSRSSRGCFKTVGSKLPHMPAPSRVAPPPSPHPSLSHQQAAQQRTPAFLFRRFLGPAICLLLTLRICWYFLQPDIANRSTNISPYYYYYNEATGQVQWEDPGDVPFEEDTGERFWLLADGSRTVEDPSRWKYAWIEQYSTELSRPYFYNQETRESVWERPFDLSWRRISVKEDE